MEKLNNFKNLKMIFGDTISALDGEMALLEIRIILDDARLNDEEKAAVFRLHPGDGRCGKGAGGFSEGASAPL